MSQNSMRNKYAGPKKGTYIENDNIPQDTVQPKCQIQYRLEVQMHSTAPALDRHALAFDFDPIHVKSKNGFTFVHVQLSMAIVHGKRIAVRYWTCRIWSSQVIGH
jgi:hypothetical protein